MITHPQFFFTTPSVGARRHNLILVITSGVSRSVRSHRDRDEPISCTVWQKQSQSRQDAKTARRYEWLSPFLLAGSGRHTAFRTPFLQRPRALPVSAFRAAGLKPARFLAVRCVVKGGRPGIRKRELLWLERLFRVVSRAGNSIFVFAHDERVILTTEAEAV